MLKSFKLGFISMWTENFQMYKLDLGKAEEPEIKLPTYAGLERKQGNSRKISTAASLSTPKPLTVFSSVQFSCSVVSDSLQPHESQHTRPPCPSLTPGVHSNSCPFSWWCHPTTSSSIVPSPPAFNLSQHQDLFQWVSSSHRVAKVLEFQLQHQSFQWIFRTDFL